MSNYDMIYFYYCFVFSIQNLFRLIHLYIGQNQDNTNLNSKQVVPHEVTCNPTDNTAHDDELSNSFASNHDDWMHHLHALYNQMNHHGIHYSHSNRGGNVAQQMQTFCPMLPPLQTEYIQNCTHQVNAPKTNVNHHLNHYTNNMNPQMQLSTNPSFQKATTTQPITQQPWQSCPCSKTPMEKAQAAIARLYRNSIASPDSSISQNSCTTTESNNNPLSQLNDNKQSQVHCMFIETYMPSAHPIQI
jgi:hypothetical protein